MTTHTLPRRSPEEIKALARDLVTNRIFLSTDPDEIQNAFGVILIFIDPDSIDFNQVAAVFEYYSEAGPISVNGLPSFLSMQVIHVDDWPEFCAEARTMMKALGIELPKKENECDHNWQDTGFANLDDCARCGITRVHDASLEKEDDVLPPEVMKWLEK